MAETRDQLIEMIDQARANIGSALASADEVIADHDDMRKRLSAIGQEAGEIDREIQMLDWEDQFTYPFRRFVEIASLGKLTIRQL